MYLAKVSDNKDPDKMDRIKVTRTLEKDAVSSWIPYLSINAGNSAGFSTLPDVDAQVLVAALDGSETSQIAVGTIWSENSKPPESGENGDADFNKDGKNALHFFKSKSENKFIVDDTKDSEKMQLVAAGGKTRFEFSKKDKLVNLETDQKIGFSAKKEMTFEADSITMKAKKKADFSMDEFQSKASKKCNIEADQDMSIKGSGVALN
jgi:Phage-related baseplate assembly protein.